MVMPDKSAHHIAALQHGDEHAGVDDGGMGFLLPLVTDDFYVRVGVGSIVFRERDMEEIQCGKGDTLVRQRVLGARFPVPLRQRTG
jgi:hypothetical protein